MLKKWSLTPLSIIALTFVLCTPALFAGYFGDDYMHHALLQESSPIQKPQDLSILGLFSFVNGDSARTLQLMDLGLLPWWTNPDLKYAFWRPISEITHWLDHKLWPSSPELMHAQNIAWYLLLLYLVHVLFKVSLPSKASVLSASAPLLAMLIYGLDSSHGFTVSWIANRNALIATTFGVSSLIFYIRWRNKDHYNNYILSLVFLCLSLLSAEFGISTCAYLGAFAIFMDKNGPIKGLTYILPHAALTGLWWLIYKVGNFGAANADAYYLDPIASPILFLSTLGERLIALIGSQWGLIPAEVFGFIGPSNQVIANVALTVGAVFISLTLLLLTPLLKQYAHLRFWFFGMLFAALPVCSAAPHDRVLLFIGLGGSYCAAAIIIAALKHTQELYGNLAPVAKLTAYPFALTHLILAPLLMPLMSYSTKIWSAQLDLAPALFSGINATKEYIENKQIILFNVPIGSALAITTTRVVKNLPLPNKLWVISTTSSETTVTRKSDNQILASKPSGFITGPEQATRNLLSKPIKIGDKVMLNGISIETIKVSDQGHPTEILLTFKNSLDDPNMMLLNWNQAAKDFEEVDIPMISKQYIFLAAETPTP